MIWEVLLSNLTFNVALFTILQSFTITIGWAIILPEGWHCVLDLDACVEFWSGNYWDGQGVMGWLMEKCALHFSIPLSTQHWCSACLHCRPSAVPNIISGDIEASMMNWHHPPWNFCMFAWNSSLLVYFQTMAVCLSKHQKRDMNCDGFYGSWLSNVSHVPPKQTD